MRPHQYLSGLCFAAALSFAGAALASPSTQDASALCGGEKDKEVKKPKDGDKHPSSQAETLCGGEKDKEVKKPKDGDKDPSSQAETLCGGEKDKEVKKPKDGDKHPNPA